MNFLCSRSFTDPCRGLKPLWTESCLWNQTGIRAKNAIYIWMDLRPNASNHYVKLLTQNKYRLFHTLCGDNIYSVFILKKFQEFGILSLFLFGLNLVLLVYFKENPKLHFYFPKLFKMVESVKVRQLINGDWESLLLSASHKKIYGYAT